MPRVLLLILVTTLIASSSGLNAQGEAAHASEAPRSVAGQWVGQLVPVNYNRPLRDYECRRLAGWSVLTEAEMDARDPQLTRRALGSLEDKLKQVRELLPSHTLKLLQRTPVFLLYGTNSIHGGRASGGQYYAPAAPDFNKSLDPRMGGSIVIFSAQHFLTMSDYGILKLLVHEFAHSWHLSQWSELKPDIMMAFKNAMANGLHMNVRNAKGQIIEKTYATKNQLEYFAELSAIWFCGSDHFPFHRADLRGYDPGGYRLMEKLWAPQVPHGDITMR